MRVAIGEPLDAEAVKSRAKDTKALMDFLRESTYALSPKPIPNLGYGYEFEEKYRA